MVLFYTQVFYTSIYFVLTIFSLPLLSLLLFLPSHCSPLFSYSFTSPCMSYTVMIFFEIYKNPGDTMREKMCNILLAIVFICLI